MCNGLVFILPDEGLLRRSKYRCLALYIEGILNAFGVYMYIYRMKEEKTIFKRKQFFLEKIVPWDPFSYLIHYINWLRFQRG